MFKVPDKFTEGFTSDQRNAFTMILEWLSDYNNELTRRQTFVLSGYAGTGKTFLIGKLFEFLKTYFGDEPIMACAFTGKATTLLLKKGMPASTLHHLIYVPTIVKKTINIDGVEAEEREVKFVKKRQLDENIKLIILDEASMVSKELFQDLLSFKLPILCVGDSGQLPPIDASTNILDKPDYTLNEITRQALDSPIIRIANNVRQGKPLQYGDFGAVKVVNRTEYIGEKLVNILLEADQVLCGLNKTRTSINNQIRKKLLGPSYDTNMLPCVGEKIICTANNWELFLDEDQTFNLCNGTIGRVLGIDKINSVPYLDKIKFKPDYINEESPWIVYDTGIFLDGKPYYEPFKKFMVSKDGTLIDMIPPDRTDPDYFSKMRDYVLTKMYSRDTIRVNNFDFAWAITVHKFQGSQASSIVLFDESYAFKEDRDKWLYTAITRAEHNILIIK